MAPESITALGALGVALIMAGPSYFAIKARGARQEAEDTRTEVSDHLVEGFSRIHQRLDSVTDQIDDIRRWQISHTAEHITLAPGPHRGDS